MLIPSGFAQVNMFFVGSPVPTGAQVTFGVDLTGFGGTAVDAAEAVRETANTEGLMTPLDSSMDMNKVLVKFGPNATGQFGEWNVPISGGASGTGLTPNTAVLVVKNTALGGRQGRGRMYFPGIPETAFDESGLINGTFQTNFAGGINDFFASLDTQFLSPVLLHGEDSPITTPTEITGFSVSSTAATQRRRLRR